MTFVGLLVLAALTLFFISLQRSYGHVPLKELKKRARAGDSIAKALYPVASYGASLTGLLWLLIVVCAAGFFSLLSGSSSGLTAFFFSAILLWFGFIWLPARQATNTSLWLAARISPLLAKLLGRLQPLLVRTEKFFARNTPIQIHTGLYDVEDLQELFARQKVQADNRVDRQTLELVEHALQFSSKTVQDILIPRRVVKTVALDASIGPLLMDDLHKSGHSRFPVYEADQDKVLGVVHLKRLVRAKSSSTIAKIMDTDLHYIHQDQPLAEALQALLRTQQQLFVVVSSFEEYVGIVTAEDIMEAIVGQQIVDEFDQYDDLRAVAQKTAITEHEKHLETEIVHENIQDVTEVV